MSPLFVPVLTVYHVRGDLLSSGSGRGYRVKPRCGELDMDLQEKLREESLREPVLVVGGRRRVSCPVGPDPKIT